jgi:hypothetical protein
MSRHKPDPKRKQDPLVGTSSNAQALKLSGWQQTIQNDVNERFGLMRLHGYGALSEKSSRTFCCPVSPSATQTAS